MEYKWITQDSDGWIKRWENNCFVLSEGYYKGSWDTDGVLQRYVFDEGVTISPVAINLETHDYKIEDGILMKVEKEQKIFKGSELQYRSDDGSWYDCGHAEYRIKPKTNTVRFRNYLDYKGIMSVTTQDISGSCTFDKWIGDWQEVEVEIEQ